MWSMVICPRMKYKPRVVVGGISAVSVLVTCVVFLDPSAHHIRLSNDKLKPVEEIKRSLIQDHVETHDKEDHVETHDKVFTISKNVYVALDKSRDSQDTDDKGLSHGAVDKEADNKADASQGQNGSENQQKPHETIMFDANVERLFTAIAADEQFQFDYDVIKNTPFKELALQLGKKKRMKSKHLLAWDSHELRDDRTSNYVRFHHGIRAAAMYDPEDPAIDGLLHDMATDTITSLKMFDRGTELKLLIRFKKGTRAVFKPMRWGREFETIPNHFYFNDFERHNAEIAAFHVDRLLGFYRVPPVTGRFFNMTKEIYNLGERALTKTFFKSPIGNTCFYGVCDYYCDSHHAFCGKGDVIEGSLMVWLPEGWEAKIDSWKSPYRRSYSKFKQADWETDDKYCLKLLKEPPYERFFLDLIDSHIFDFITGNMDRHHVQVFTRLRNDSCPIHLDNGRGFGKANVDEFSILTPLHQCCVIRKSTFLKLAKLYIGPERLSVMLDNSLKSDPVYPVLLPDHLKAVDRRVVHILSEVAKCSTQYSLNSVIIADGF